MRSLLCGSRLSALLGAAVVPSTLACACSRQCALIRSDQQKMCWQMLICAPFSDPTETPFPPTHFCPLLQQLLWGLWVHVLIGVRSPLYRGLVSFLASFPLTTHVGLGKQERVPICLSPFTLNASSNTSAVTPPSSHPAQIAHAKNSTLCLSMGSSSSQRVSCCYSTLVGSHLPQLPQPIHLPPSWILLPFLVLTTPWPFSSRNLAPLFQVRS